jgi:enterochelin esterase-like enzyme
LSDLLIRRSIVVVLALMSAVTAGAQGRRGAPPSAAARAGTMERVMVQGRDVLVYLPPSYASDAMRRFPVVYLLAELPIDNLKLQDAADRLAAQPGFSEPIVVLPDVPRSAGDPESLAKFVAGDLIAYVDGKYRTMTARISRGLGGSSLGGAAALRVGMKRPAVFSSLFLLSASLVDATVAMLDADAAGLQRYYSVSINVGTGDAALAVNRRLHDAMTRLGIPHYYEEFDGAHADHAAERIETRVLPFFSKNLLAPANPTSPAVQ